MSVVTVTMTREAAEKAKRCLSRTITVMNGRASRDGIHEDPVIEANRKRNDREAAEWLEWLEGRINIGMTDADPRGPRPLEDR